MTKMRWPQRMSSAMLAPAQLFPTQETDMTLKDRRIVILGGTSGIGLATAQAAAQEGASVVVVSSRQASVDRAVASLPAGTEGHAVDLASEDAIRALFDGIG